MLTIVGFSVISAALAGLLVKYIQDLRKTNARITWKEYTIGMLVISFILAPVVSYIGWQVAKNSQLTFSEYRNGWEMAAVKTITNCERDGACDWEYQCDPYIVQVPYSCRCDSKGSNCSTCYRNETRYHSCPYVDAEYGYSVQTTLGSYGIAKGVFPPEPQKHRWRKTESIPQSTIDQATVGDPSFWLEVKRRCETNRPGPVTNRQEYVNYILASDQTLFKNHSSDIETYQKDKLLPALGKNIENFYHAKKVHFVGFTPQRAHLWQNALEYLNGELGSSLQGNLQVVIVKNETISANPDRYALALKAHWQNISVFGHDALAKNDTVVIIGTTDEQTVSWSRAFTGMPLGNEKMLAVLRDGLVNTPFSIEAIFGPIESRRTASKTSYPPVSDIAGALTKIVLGMEDPSTKFKRVSMSGKDGGGGFLYLKNEVQLSSAQKWVIFMVTFVICCGAWVVASIHEGSSETRTSSFRRTRRTL